MADADDNNQDGVVNLIDDAVIANAHAIGVFLTAHLLNTVRAWFVRQRINLWLDDRLHVAR